MLTIVVNRWWRVFFSLNNFDNKRKYHQHLHMPFLYGGQSWLTISYESHIRTVFLFHLCHLAKLSRYLYHCLPMSLLPYVFPFAKFISPYKMLKTFWLPITNFSNHFAVFIRFLDCLICLSVCQLYAFYFTHKTHFLACLLIVQCSGLTWIYQYSKEEYRPLTFLVHHPLLKISMPFA